MTPYLPLTPIISTIINELLLWRSIAFTSLVSNGRPQFFLSTIVRYGDCYHDQAATILEDSFGYNEAQFPIDDRSTGSQAHYNHPVLTVDCPAVMPNVNGQSDRSVEFWG